MRNNYNLNILYIMPKKVKNIKKKVKKEKKYNSNRNTISIKIDNRKPTNRRGPPNPNLKKV